MSAEILQIDVEAAQRRVERMRFHATAMNDSAQSLLKTMHTARELEDHVTLGYASWPALLVDVFGDEPLRLTREARREVVAEMSNAGMSTRAIAPLVGAARNTVMSDLKQVAQSEPPAPVEVEGMTVNPATGEVLDNTDFMRGVLQDAEDNGGLVKLTGPASVSSPTVTEHTVTEKIKTVTGLDGKEYKRPEPAAPRRKSLVDDAMKARHELWAAISQIQTIMQDDRYKQNKADIQDALHPATRLASEVFANLFDTKESEQI